MAELQSERQSQVTRPYAEASDAILAKALSPARDDDQAWEEFYRRYAPILLGFVHARVRALQPADAEDLLAEIVIKIHRNIDTFVSTRPGSFKSWCFRIAQNTYIDFLRQKKSPAAELVSLDELIEELTNVGMSKALPIQGRADDARAEVLSANEREVREAFLLLNTRDQALIELWLNTDYPDQQVASIIGVPVDYVRKYRDKAFNKLRRARDGVRSARMNAKKRPNGC